MCTSFLLSTGSFETCAKKAPFCQVQFCSHLCWEFYLAHNVSESQEHQLCTVWSKIKLNWGNLQLQSYHQPNLRIAQIFPTASLHSTIYAWHFLGTTVFFSGIFFLGHFFLQVQKYVKISWKMRRLSQNVSKKIRSLRCGQCLVSMF